MNEEIVLAFVRSTIKSAWSLELLLLLQRNPEQSWPTASLIRELRGSEHLVNQSLAVLTDLGIVEVSEAGARYRPQTAELAELVSALVELYAQKPITVLRTIFTSPSEKIRSFSDAFLFRKDTER